MVVPKQYQCTACSKKIDAIPGESFKDHPDYCGCNAPVTSIKVNNKSTGKPEKYTLGKVTRPKVRRKK